MTRTPITDIVDFLTEPSAATLVFWLLIVASVAIAIMVARADPAQRTPKHVGDLLLRFVVGAMWWQQSLWKLPPYYTDDPQAPFGTTGLAFWMRQMAEYAPFKLQARLVEDPVLAHFYVFAPLVYLTELFIAVSLILGLFTRLGGLAGALMALNLWAGLYLAPHEWPWTYFFLVVIQVLFTLHPPGRSLGLDALLRVRATSWRHRGLARLVRLAT
jgi:uncharacterized membrane protein YphA (DoxX/SURF4 family)